MPASPNAPSSRLSSGRPSTLLLVLDLTRCFCPDSADAPERDAEDPSRWRVQRPAGGREALHGLTDTAARAVGSCRPESRMDLTTRRANGGGHGELGRRRRASGSFVRRRMRRSPRSNCSASSERTGSRPTPCASRSPGVASLEQREYDGDVLYLAARMQTRQDRHPHRCGHANRAGARPSPRP
jgi:hypothetical protein